MTDRFAADAYYGREPQVVFAEEPSGVVYEEVEPVSVLKKIRPYRWLFVGLALMLLGGILGQLFHTSFYRVRIEDITFETERGTISALLYMPRNVNETHHAPGIVMTHGYLNSREMQDLNAIELSRRGYVVLALSMYDHGASRWDADIPVGGQFGTFWIHSQWDAAQWLYEQPFIARDADGNGRIGVTGHSMGGFSSTLAIYFDEIRFLQTGTRIIEAGLSVGADFLHAGAVAPQDELMAAMGPRSMGFIAGQYDEFFFNDLELVGVHGGSVIQSLWTETPAGQAFLGTTNPEPETVYTVASGPFYLGGAMVRPSVNGQRIAYTPAEIHPWNHFSATSVGYVIDFFEWALPNPGAAEVTGQIWQFKVLFNVFILAGFFLLLPPLMTLLLRVPLLSRAVTPPADPVPMIRRPWYYGAWWLALILGIGLPAFLIPTLMERRDTGLGLLQTFFGILAALGLAAAILALVWGRQTTGGASVIDNGMNVGGEHFDDDAGFAADGGAPGLVSSDDDAAAFANPATGDLMTTVVPDNEGALTARVGGNPMAWGGFLIALLAALSAFVVLRADTFLQLSPFLSAPTINVIAFWALISAGITGILITIMYLMVGRYGARAANYGLGAGVLPIIASLVVAVIGVAIAYGLMFLVERIFNMDGRLWVFAVPTFTSEVGIAAVRYMPFFLVFYFINTIALNANMRGRRGGYVWAALQNILGILIWVAIQYGLLFQTGVAWYPTMSLNAILLFGLIPVLALAGVFARALYDRTNNIWLAAFTNTILFTLISVANTAVFWNLVPAA
ncbi:MAG: hypothetical protein FWG25_00475 [Promicromonosporaceae bacterium]|nr:hypothetical protein [Promicromonosporaceae bacterium]